MDASLYSALTLMSQPWNMRYPLITWHGNNGSPDGDPPAASRYTECKLSPYGELMIQNLKKNTVDWTPAYTNEEDEPVYLTSYLPNLLVNGTFGIAWSMSCRFLPTNLTEIMDASVLLLDNPKATMEDLVQIVQGPDFPTGGIIINKNDMLGNYSAGTGRVIVRGEYVIEHKPSGDLIVFTSVPYEVSKEKLLIKIDELCESGVINGVQSIRDESSGNKTRFVIELEPGVASARIINLLFKNTQLQNNYSINQNALVNKVPKMLSLKDLLMGYIDHQRDVLLRKTQYELTKIEAQLEILKGLIIALNNIDAVIDIIKKSKSASEASVTLANQSWGLTESQIKAILKMPLSKLAKLEADSIRDDEKKMVAEQNRLLGILNDPTNELKVIFTDIRDKYGDARRTTISQIEEEKEDKEIINVEPQKCVVVLTQDGSIKKIPSESFRIQRRNGKGIKNKNAVSQLIKTNTIDSLLVFTDQGQMYKILVDNIPTGTNVGAGVAINSLVPMAHNEKPILIYSLQYKTEAQYIVFITKNGMIKKSALSEYTKAKKASGIKAINLREGDSLASIFIDGDSPVILLTKNGFGIKYSLKEIAATGRNSAGVKAMTLSNGDEIVAGVPVRDAKDKLAIFSEQGYGKCIALTELPLQKRGGKGIIVYKPSDVVGNITCCSLVTNEDTVLLAGKTSSICISAAEIPLLGRSAIGSSLIQGTVTSATKV